MPPEYGFLTKRSTAFLWKATTCVRNCRLSSGHAASRNRMSQLSPAQYGITPAPIPPLPFIIEVSDSTLRYDRAMKASLYARAGIMDYWILNLIDRVLEVHRTCCHDRYAAWTRLPQHHAPYGHRQYCSPRRPAKSDRRCRLATLKHFHSNGCPSPGA